MMYVDILFFIYIYNIKIYIYIYVKRETIVVIHVQRLLVDVSTSFFVGVCVHAFFLFKV